MPDLNRLIASIEEESKEIKVKLRELFENYDELYRDGNRQFRTERTISAGSMEGLEEFRKLILYIKRNKDVVASLMRGVLGLRILSNFQFIEEDVVVPKTKSKKRKTPTTKITKLSEFMESVPVEAEGD